MPPQRDAHVSRLSRDANLATESPAERGTLFIIIHHSRGPPDPRCEPIQRWLSPARSSVSRLGRADDRALPTTHLERLTCRCVVKRRARKPLSTEHRLELGDAHVSRLSRHRIEWPWSCEIRARRSLPRVGVVSVKSPVVSGANGLVWYHRLPRCTL